MTIPRITLLARSGNMLTEGLRTALQQMAPAHECEAADIESFCGQTSGNEAEASYVYAPSPADKDGMTSDLPEAERVFRHVADFQGSGPEKRKFVLLSSALIYGTGPGRHGLVPETYSPARNGTQRICDQWSLLEELAIRYLREKLKLTILRPATLARSSSLLSRRLAYRMVPTLPGHDPTLQLLSVSDLAAAISLALAQDKPGVFNVAPDGTVPLHAAIRLSGHTRLPIPRTLQRIAKGSDKLEYLRYPWTVANDKIKQELGFVPGKSSVAALLESVRHKNDSTPADPGFDEFGMDKRYIEFYGKTLFRFLCERYWRIEDKGLEHVPRQGRGVLVGTHRGFMPFDGVMAFHVLVQKTGRFPRFLTHPTLLKFPFLANFMTKLGGVVACQESADYVLRKDELLGIFPEGIDGTFTLYRDAHKLQAFGRDAFVKVALRNRAPIVPFVTIGSAEIFPIFGKIKSRLWTRHVGWPFIPITTPVPLPSKWHMQFLPPIHVEEQFPPEAAQDRSVIKAISLEVRTRMQQAMDEIVSRRPSIFFGSVFGRGRKSGPELEPKPEAGR